MTEPFYDALETRDPAVREAALMAALPLQVARAQRASIAYAERLSGVDAAAVTSRAALATLPVTRKHELLQRQQASRADPDDGDPFGGFSTIGWRSWLQAQGRLRTHGAVQGVPDTSNAPDAPSGPDGRQAPPPSRSPGRALRVFQSPGPIYEPEGASPDYWRGARALFAAGFRAGDLVHNSFGYHLTPAGSLIETAAHALGCTVFPAGTGHTELQLQALADLRPDGYCGTPSFLKILLDKAAEAGLALPSLRKALVSGEAFPPSLQRAVAALGVEAYQCYATADLGLVAYETAAREGLVLDEHVIVEIVRPGTGEPVPEPRAGEAPEVGEVVVTTLNPNYPLVRFGTGDLSAVLPGRCPTGRSNTRIRGWLGRADQTTKVRGMFVHPGQVAAVLRRHPEAGRGRLVVSGETGDDRMLLRVEAATRPDGLGEHLAESLREVTKLRGEVELVDPGSLPNDGKAIEDARRYE